MIAHRTLISTGIAGLLAGAATGPTSTNDPAAVLRDGDKWKIDDIKESLKT